MALKANGEVRICADYKCTLNKALQQYSYPVPVVSHILASLQGGYIFAKLDLAQAYQQLVVDNAMAEAQTIVTHRGAFKQSRPEMPQAPVYRWDTTHAPWSRVHIDYAGPFQGQLFLIVVDSHSKWLEITPVTTMMTARTIQVLRGIFASHGLPDVLTSDNGPQFTSSEFQSFLRVNMIRHATSAPFHPASNGQVERMVHTTKEALKRLTHGNWHHRLADFFFCHRTTPCTSPGKSPAELRWARWGTPLLAQCSPLLDNFVEFCEHMRLMYEDPIKTQTTTQHLKALRQG
ncbi:uncharacterized protein K02A2.6-like [Crotalus tigris]|uniref:uncharacterized protein K02A2.6-like n=1 Tax=Crotalus tigris TaxID=88082 RepID=UPI00192F8547|nr:uncharacterized protein K02A2.6-like [Crotalus tigris]